MPALGREAEGHPCPDAEQHHEQRLHGMDDEHKVEGVGGAHAVEDEHRLHGEVPGARSVGGGDDDRDAAHDERHDGTIESQPACGFETEEREVVVEEVARPDGHRPEHVERRVVDLPQTGDAHEEVAQHVLYLVVHRQPPRQIPYQPEGRQPTHYRHHPARGTELREERVEARTGAGEEDVEDANLEYQRQTCDEHHQQRVDHALGHHRTQGLGERHAVVALQHRAARELADARHDERRGVAQEYGIHRHALPRVLSRGLQGLPPAPAADCLRQDAEGERQQHPRPVHVVEQHLLDLREVKIAIHPIKNGAAQEE